MLRGAYEGLTQAPGAAGQIPGYQDTYPGQTSYYDNPEAMQSDGAVAGWRSEAYQTANSTTRPTVDVTRSDLSRATAIEADPNAYLDGMSADGSTGSCTPLPPGSGTANTAEWTCHVGSSVVEQPQTCTRSLTVAEWNDTLYQYLCVTAAGFDGCASLVGNRHVPQDRELSGSRIWPDGRLLRLRQPVSDPNAYLMGTLPKPPPAGAFQVVEQCLSLQHARGCRCPDLRSRHRRAAAIPDRPPAMRADCRQCQLHGDQRRRSWPCRALRLCKTWDFIGDPFAAAARSIASSPPRPRKSTSAPQMLPG